MSPRRLGPFELHGVLGRGGMGTVWDARHGPSGLDVALKTVRPEVAGAAFHREVQAVAALRHDGIVEVFDEGVVTDAESDDELPAGTGYLVMARLDGGTLVQAGAAMDWLEVKTTLRQMLDALAHAHARGVLHLDLKPGNVLRDVDGSWTLVDFGLAHLADAERSGVVAGTPPYMAPEQLQGRWRDYAAGTDLFALGCIAWELIAGRRWRSTDPAGALSAALAGAPEPAARMAVPAGLDDWLQGLLAPSPDARFETAAEARFALEQLGPPVLRPEPSWSPVMLPVDTFDMESPFTGVLPESALLGAMPGGPPPEMAPLARRPAPPLPSTWSRAPTRPPTGGLGLGLVGIRALTSIGRRKARERLWGRLGEALRTGCSHAVALTGPTGVGRTHLARWLAGRAGETGAVRVISVRGDDPAAILRQLLDRVAHLEGLEPEAAAERLRSRARAEGIDPVLVEALARWVRGEEGGEAVPSLAALWLRQLARRRPVLWVLDDSGAAAWGLVEEVVRRGSDGRQPLLAVVCSDASSEADVEELRLGPLPPARWFDLVRGVLGLAPELAVQVEARAAGSPGVAVQLVQALAQQGVLVPSGEGYRLPEGFRLEEVRLDPDARVQAVLDGFPEGAADALEIAATLGHQVPLDEWRAAARAAEVAIVAGPLEACVRRGLVVREEGSLVFGSAGVRETLLERARAGRRLQRWHLACSEALRGGPDRDRLGQHLVAAGRVDEGLPALLDGVRERFRATDLRGAAALQAQAMAALQATTPAVVRLRAWHWGAWLATMSGDDATGAAWAERVLADPGLPEAPRSEGVAAHALGVIAVQRHEPGARALLERAVAAYERGGASQYRAYAWMMLLDLDPDATGREALLVGLTGSGDRDLAALAHLRLCARRATEGRLDEAEAHALAVRDDAATHGPFHRMLDAWLRLGDLARLQGRLDEAERTLRAARGLASPAGAHALLASANLALVRTEQGRFDAADRLWDGVFTRASRADWFRFFGRRGAFLLCRTPCRAASGDTDAFDTDLAEGLELCAQARIAEPDAARMLRLAGELWRGRGDEERARAALVAGLDQARGAHESRELDRIERLLSTT